MRAPKPGIRAVLLSGVLTSTMVTGGTIAAVDLTPAVAHAEAAAPAGAAPGGVALAYSPLLEVAKRLPKVSAQQVLHLAKSQVGVSENMYGGGTKFHDWYMNSERAGETVLRDGGNRFAYANAPWCDMFVSWVGDQLGISPVMGEDAYTVRHAEWFEQNNRWGTAPVPGAVVFFDWNGGKNIHDIQHVGFVVKDNGDGTIETVEGNTGNGAVEVRERQSADVVGYGYPVYTG
ncbi:CHAP domain-containing protein [Herbidospora sp. RD11066]